MLAGMELKNGFVDRRRYLRYEIRGGTVLQEGRLVRVDNGYLYTAVLEMKVETR
jgi:hypothetical protein